MVAGTSEGLLVNIGVVVLHRFVRSGSFPETPLACNKLCYMESFMLNFCILSRDKKVKINLVVLCANI
jgi:hypothetical protein